MIQKFIDTKVSLPQLVTWLIMVIGATFTISSAYGRYEARTIYQDERLGRLEASFAKLEVLTRQQSDTLIEVMTELKSIKKDTKK